MPIAYLPKVRVRHRSHTNTAGNWARRIQGVRVLGIETSHNAEHARGVLDAASHGAYVIQTVGQRECAVQTNPPIGGF